MFCIQRWLNLVLDLLAAAMAVVVVALAMGLKETSSAGSIITGHFFDGQNQLCKMRFQSILIALAVLFRLGVAAYDQQPGIGISLSLGYA